MKSEITLLNCKGRLLDLSSPQVMGIINVTPDSFYNGGILKTESDILSVSERMIEDGAAVLDVGGMSSRPGAKEVSEEEELKRVIPAITAICRNFPETIISVDSYRSRIVKEAVNAGAAIVNDISAGRFDQDLLMTVAQLQVPYILMHMQGSPVTMQEDPSYENVVREVFNFIKEKLLELKALGIKDIIIDPGFGFGKTVEQNFQLLNHLDVFKIYRQPILAGLSRKSIICKVLKVNPDKALNGTTALNAIALIKGAKLLRVHDIKEAEQTIQLIRMLHG